MAPAALWMTADALPPALRRDHGGGGPPVLVASRCRPVRHRAGGEAQPPASCGIVEGGSTITQQVAKLLLARRSPGRRSRGLARQDLRDGARAAARAAVQQARDPRAVSEPRRLRQPDRRRRDARAAPTSAVDASMLTPAQAAFLAGLPQRPSAFNPYRRLDAGACAPARRRPQRWTAAGLLTAGAAREARAGALDAHGRHGTVPGAALRRDGAASRRRSAARRIETTLDAALQAMSPGSSRATASTLTAHGAAQRRGRRARQRHGRMARVGRVGRLHRAASTAARSTARWCRGSRDRR